MDPGAEIHGGDGAQGGAGVGASLDPMLAEAAAALLARRPGAGPLDAGALARLAEVLSSAAYPAAANPAAANPAATNPAAVSPDTATPAAATPDANPADAPWLDAAGLRDADSCGYPVAGGYMDVRGDLAVMPAVVADPSRIDAVMGRLLQQWADDYVLTGSARLDHPWRQWAVE